MKATCYNKNRPLFTCTIEKNRITAFHELLDEEHLPIILQGTDMNNALLTKWMQSRQIPEIRDGIKEARTLYPDFERYKNRFSLSDQYWFKFKKETWEKGNYFTNDFSEETGKIFFDWWNVTSPQESPDLTTNGVLKKRWTIRDGKRCLIKAGSRECHQEPISEILASMTLEQLDIIPFVKYSLTIEGMQMCCICENFVDQNSEYVPFTHIYNKEPRTEDESVYEHAVRMAKKYGIKDPEDYLDRMICVDHYICNTDRNLGNFGFLRDVETGKLTGFAPLFDCGSAFFTLDTKSMSFGDHEKRCTDMFKAEIKKKNMNQEPLIRLVKAYPAITAAEEHSIIKKLNRVYEEMAGSIKEKLERMSEEDLLFS